MKSRVLILITACAVGFCQLARAQRIGLVEPSRPGGVTAPKVEDEDLLAASAVTFTGKLVFSFTITVTSSLPASDTIACEASAEVDDLGANGQGPVISETAAVAATRGSTTTCTVTIPYSWSLINSTTDMVQLSYIITAPAASSAGTTGLPFRASSKSFSSIKVPATGATTTETIKATI